MSGILPGARPPGRVSSEKNSMLGTTHSATRAPSGHSSRGRRMIGEYGNGPYGPGCMEAPTECRADQRNPTQTTIVGALAGSGNTRGALLSDEGREQVVRQRGDLALGQAGRVRIGRH